MKYYKIKESNSFNVGDKKVIQNGLNEVSISGGVGAPLGKNIFHKKNEIQTKRAK